MGALAGVHLASKTSYVKFAYNKEEHLEVERLQEERANDAGEEYEKKKDESAKMNMKTMKKILFYWAITLPTAFAFCAFLTWILHFTIPNKV